MIWLTDAGAAFVLYICYLAIDPQDKKAGLFLITVRHDRPTDMKTLAKLLGLPGKVRTFSSGPFSRTFSRMLSGTLSKNDPLKFGLTADST